MNKPASMRLTIVRTTVAMVALLAGIYFTAPWHARTFSVIKNWTGNTSTDWNDPGNWGPFGVPAATDDVNIPTGVLPHEPSIISVDVTINSLTLATGRTLTIGDGRIITINGSTSPGMTINGTVTTSGTGTGLFRTQGFVTGGVSGTFNAPFEVNNGTARIDSSSTFGKSLNVASGGATFFVNNSATVTVNGDVTIGYPSAIDGSTGVFNFNGSSFTTFNLVTVGSVNFGGTTQLLTCANDGFHAPLRILSGSTTTIDYVLSGTLTIDAGATVNIGNTTELLLLGPGLPLINNGTLNTANRSIEYRGTAPQTVATANISYYRLIINNAAGVNLPAPTTVSNYLWIEKGVFTIGGNLTMADGSEIHRYNGSFSGTPIFGTSIDVYYEQTNPVININTGTEIPTSSSVLRNLLCENTGGVTLNSPATVNHELGIGKGVLTNGANLTMVTGSLIQRGDGSLAAAPTFGSSVDVQILGNNPVTTGPEIPTAPTVLNNLTIENFSTGVTLGGNATVNGLLVVASGFSVSSHTLTINNGILPINGTLASAPTGTVIYNQSSDGQTVICANYGNLTFSNFNKVLDSTQVVGTTTIGIAGTFTPGTATGHTITDSTIEFNGSSAQVAPAFHFNNLEINNAAGVTLSGNVLVDGTLTLTAGNITTGAHSVTLGAGGSVARTSGHVIGELEKEGLAAPFTFPVGTASGYTPLLVSNVIGSGDLSVRTVAAPQPVLNPANSLHEYWSLRRLAGPVTVDLTFNYLQGDVAGNEANYRIIRVSDNNPTGFPNACPSSPCVDAIANTATMSGVSSFSDWTLGEPTCPNSIIAASQSFAANGGTGSFAVSADGGCSWTAANHAPSFITITSGGSGTGNGMVNFSVTANVGSTIRNGTITVGPQTFTIYQGIGFNDVPSNDPFYNDIGKLAARGVTVGCGGGNYCPNDPVTREQMAAFIMRAKGEFSPPTPASQRFQDVPPSNVFYNFIDRLAVLQITLGCTPDHLMYCPSDAVKREQMAAFLIRGLGEFNPPTPPSQRFTDVSPSNVFYNFIDRLAVLQITLGCTPDHTMYCPSDSVTRAQMAAFLVRAFNL